MDPYTLLEKPDGSAARRGWLPLWNLESESDWLDRLRRSPPKLVAAFLLWSPTAPRIRDFDLLVCLSRPLQEPERRLLAYELEVRIAFAGGTTDSMTLRSSPLSRFGLQRCTPIAEQHPLIGARREFSVSTDLRYRPGRIASVSATLRLDGEAVGTGTFTPSLHIRPAPRTESGDAKATRAFIAGRAKGEALRSARRCSNIATIQDIARPAEDDQSVYARGFALGWRLAGAFLDSDERCDALPRVFAIEEVGIGPAIRAETECVRPLALTGGGDCLRTSE